MCTSICHSKRTITSVISIEYLRAYRIYTLVPLQLFNLRRSEVIRRKPGAVCSSLFSPWTQNVCHIVSFELSNSLKYLLYRISASSISQRCLSYFYIFLTRQVQISHSVHNIVFKHSVALANHFICLWVCAIQSLMELHRLLFQSSSSLCFRVNSTACFDLT